MYLRKPKTPFENFLNYTTQTDPYSNHPLNNQIYDTVENVSCMPRYTIKNDFENFTTIEK